MQVGLEFSHLHNFISKLIYLRIKYVNLCSNDTLGITNTLQSMNHLHSKYPEKFNNVKEGKKLGPEIAYGQTHNYGSSAFELSRFHCNQLNNKISVIFFVSHCVLRKGYVQLVDSDVSLYDSVTTSAMIHLYKADF